MLQNTQPKLPRPTHPVFDSQRGRGKAHTFTRDAEPMPASGGSITGVSGRSSTRSDTHEGGAS